MVVNLDNTKVGRIMLDIKERYLDEIREAANTERNKPLTRELIQAFLSDYDKLDTEVFKLNMSHALFFSSVTRMNELMEEYALDAITEKVFPKQLQAYRALLKLVVTLANYYNEENNKVGVVPQNTGAEGTAGSR